MSPDLTYHSLLLHQKEHKKRFGLTIPFLIGALRAPMIRPDFDEDDALAELNQLLEAMRDGFNTVRIAECTNLHQPVAALYAGGEWLAANEAVCTPRHNRSSLYVERRYFKGKKQDITSIAESLWGILGEAIMARNFSFRGGLYAPFDAADQKFIDAARVTLPKPK